MADTGRVVRVLVADDHALVREGIVRRLEAEGDIVVVGVAGDAAGCAELFRELAPDVTLVDHLMPGMSGLDLVRQLLAEAPQARLVVLSGFDDRALVTAALSAGAVGFITKTAPGAEMVRCVREAAAGNRALDAVATERVLEQLADPTRRLSPGAERGPLTARELQVLALVADGRTNEQIAEALFISVQTVKTHLSRVFARLGVSDRASAAAKALRDGLLT